MMPPSRSFPSSGTTKQATGVPIAAVFTSAATTGPSTITTAKSSRKEIATRTAPDTALLPITPSAVILGTTAMITTTVGMIPTGAAIASPAYRTTTTATGGIATLQTALSTSVSRAKRQSGPPKRRSTNSQTVARVVQATLSMPARCITPTT